MNNVKVIYKKPTLNDIDIMQKLIQPEIESGTILYRSADEIATNIRSYMIAVIDEQIIGFCALHIYSEKLAEIRSIIIDKKYRGMQIGKNLILKLIEEGKILGVRQVFALTYERGFFEKIGFIEIEKEKLPEQKIWMDCIKCKHFPICNEIAFIKQI